MEDLLVLLLVVVCTSVYLVYSLFTRHEGTGTFQFWEKLALQKQAAHATGQSFQGLDAMQLAASLPHDGTDLSPPTDHTTFVLSDYSLPVCRSLWRIVEYTITDFVDYWYVKISDSPEFGNDLRDVFDHAFNVLGERSIKIDWSSFVVKNVISNLNYLMRIYRLTEQEVNSHNPFFAQTPEAARHRLLKAELLRNYKLHVAVSEPTQYLRKLSTAILSRILRSSDFRSETMRTLARECLTAYVFIPTMGFADPYWVNYGVVCALKAMPAAPAEADKEAEPSKSQTTKKQPSGSGSKSSAHSNVSYSSISNPASRSTSPERSVSGSGGLGVSSYDDFSHLTTEPLSPGGRTSTVAEGDEEGAEWNGTAATVPAKESVLTHKMKQWEGEKAKRQEKKKHRKHGKHGGHGLHMGGSQMIVAPDGSIIQPVLAHDDDVPTGLISPQGAFSHSPNHGLGVSPSSVQVLPNGVIVPPNPSQLSSNWEVRIIGAGIRFDPKPFVMYQLLVKNGPNLKWTVVKRYSAFEDLHQKLKKAIPSFDAQLPKKHLYNNKQQHIRNGDRWAHFPLSSLPFFSSFGNLDQQFIQNRKVELQTYLGQLLWNRTVQEHADLQQFLLPSADDAKWAQTSNGVGPAGTAANTPATTSGAATAAEKPEKAEKGTFSFFKKDKPKEKTDAGAAAAAAPDSNSSTSSSSNNNHAFTSTAAMTMPTGGYSALQVAANDEDEDIFAEPSSTASSSSSFSGSSSASAKRSKRKAGAQQHHHASSSLAASATFNSAAAMPATAASAAAPSAAASPPLSPAGKRVPRTYSADDLSKQQQQQQQQQNQFDPRSPSAFPLATSASTAALSTDPAPKGGWEDKSWTDPLYALVEEMFNLNGRGWMRRQTTWVAKQLVKLTMDSLVKNKLDKSVEGFISEESISSQVDWICDIIWPNGVLYTPAALPSPEETLRMKLEAQETMRKSIPLAMRALLGKDHCVAAMENFFQFLQMEPLINHFAYSVLDSLVLEMFPDLHSSIGR